MVVPPRGVAAAPALLLQVLVAALAHVPSAVSLQGLEEGIPEPLAERALDAIGAILVEPEQQGLGRRELRSHAGSVERRRREPHAVATAPPAAVVAAAVAFVAAPSRRVGCRRWRSRAIARCAAVPLRARPPPVPPPSALARRFGTPNPNSAREAMPAPSSERPAEEGRLPISDESEPRLQFVGTPRLIF